MKSFVSKGKTILDAISKALIRTDNTPITNILWRE